MASTTTTATVSSEAYTFEHRTYNGVSIIVNTQSGYINASKMGDETRRSRDYLRTDRFKDICRCFKDFAVDTEPLLQMTNVPNEYKGVYIHPKLVHFVAEWVDLKYAFTVAAIMDSINDKVHEVLEEQQLPDTVDNAKPILADVVSAIIPVNSSYVEQRCWGYRDSNERLDSWEQHDLRRAIDEYKDIKEHLQRVEAKVDAFSGFIEMYHPDFVK